MNKTELLESKHFCIQPFIHSCIWTDGKVIPCCVNHMYEFGNVKTQKVTDLYSNNNEKLVEFRKQMIDGPELPKSCLKCEYMEQNYASNSLRYYSNKSYGYLIDQIDFDENGFVKDNKVFTWDVRYSNLCNLKCRTCDGVNSSKIAEENRKVKNWDIPVLREAFDDREEFFDFFKNNLDNVEEIYFCGGEPLLLEEHYKILDLLLENNKTNLLLRYSTNATRFEFKGKNVVDEYWTKFPRIQISLSLDAGWEQLYLIRHGAEWDTVIKNLKHLVNVCPNVFITFTPTISILNVFQISKLHKFLVSENLIGVSNTYFNILTFPDYYSITSLDENTKEKVKIHWLNYKEELKQLNCNSYMEDEIDKVIKFIDIEESQYSYSTQSERLNIFIEKTKEMDQIRNENTGDIIPELKELLNKIS